MEQKIQKDQQEFNSNWNESIEYFDDCGFKPDLLGSIYGFGLSNFSKIQSQAILAILKRKDLIAKVSEDMGTSTAYVIGTLQIIEQEVGRCQALFLVPTLEVAQVTEFYIKEFGENLQISVQICSSTTESSNKQEEDNQIIVGTAEAIYERLKKGLIKSDDIKIVVFDRIDQIFTRGFENQVREIFKILNEDTQKLLFTVVISPEILEFSKEFLIEPARLYIKNEDVALEETEQFYITLQSQELKIQGILKMCGDACKKIFFSSDFTQDFPKMIIYCNDQKDISEIEKKLKEQGLLVCSIVI